MSGNKSASAAGGRASELIYCAAVEKIEDQRKPDDFFGHRKRGGQISRSEISPWSAAGGRASELIYCAAVEKIEDQRKPDDFFGSPQAGPSQIPRSGISP